MSKVKIHIDSQDPSLETIRKYKDFNKVKGQLPAQYSFWGQRKLFFKDKKFQVLLILLGLLFLLYLLEELF